MVYTYVYTIKPVKEIFMKSNLIYYIFLVNLIAFVLIYTDKQKSIRKKWRIKESTIIFLSLIGGSIGTYIGMYTFRHKTKHLKFTLGVPMIILAQVLAYIFIIKEMNNLF